MLCTPWSRARHLEDELTNDCLRSNDWLPSIFVLISVCIAVVGQHITDIGRRRESSAGHGNGADVNILIWLRVLGAKGVSVSSRSD